MLTYFRALTGMGSYNKGYNILFVLSKRWFIVSLKKKKFPKWTLKGRGAIIVVWMVEDRQPIERSSISHIRDGLQRIRTIKMHLIESVFSNSSIAAILDAKILTWLTKSNNIVRRVDFVWTYFIVNLFSILLTHCRARTGKGRTTAAGSASVYIQNNTHTHV